MLAGEQARFGELVMIGDRCGDGEGMDLGIVD
jgi:hypothetical protein